MLQHQQQQLLPLSFPHIPFLLVQPAPYSQHPSQEGVRYVRDGIRQILCCMGIKHRHANKVAQLVFQRVAAQLPELSKPHHRRSASCVHWGVWPQPGSSGEVCVSLPRTEFYELLCSCLAEHNYKCTPSSDELKVACSLRERRKCVVVLICGTSGSGKSTLASILANRLGITTVISTDSVRHMLRSFTTKEESPLLYASTYQAGEALLPSQRGASLGGSSNSSSTASQQQQQQQQQQQYTEKPGVTGSALERAILGYKAQCEPVVHKLDALITDFEARKQSLVIEGVHLSISLVLKLMQRHPSVVPFLVYIKSEAKHVERMAVRAKYMTLDPQKNRYVAHMRCIRWIQDYLVRKADLHSIPKVENSNVDQSVGLIHIALTGMLRRTMRGEAVLDPKTNTTRALHAELRAAAESLSTTSKAIIDQVRAMRLADLSLSCSSAPLPLTSSHVLTAASGGQAAPLSSAGAGAGDAGTTAAGAAAPLPASGPELGGCTGPAGGVERGACSFTSCAFEEVACLAPCASTADAALGGAMEGGATGESTEGTARELAVGAEEGITASSGGEEAATRAAATAAAAAFAAGSTPLGSGGLQLPPAAMAAEAPWRGAAFAFDALACGSGSRGAPAGSFALPLLDTAPKPSVPAAPAAAAAAAAARSGWQLAPAPQAPAGPPHPHLQPQPGAGPQRSPSGPVLPAAGGQEDQELQASQGIQAGLLRMLSPVGSPGRLNGLLTCPPPPACAGGSVVRGQVPAIAQDATQSGAAKGVPLQQHLPWVPQPSEPPPPPPPPQCMQHEQLAKGPALAAPAWRDPAHLTDLQQQPDQGLQLLQPQPAAAAAVPGAGDGWRAWGPVKAGLGAGAGAGRGGDGGAGGAARPQAIGARGSSKGGSGLGAGDGYQGDSEPSARHAGSGASAAQKGSLGRAPHAGHGAGTLLHAQGTAAGREAAATVGATGQAGAAEAPAVQPEGSTNSSSGKAVDGSGSGVGRGGHVAASVRQPQLQPQPQPPHPSPPELLLPASPLPMQHLPARLCKELRGASGSSRSTSAAHVRPDMQAEQQAEAEEEEERGDVFREGLLPMPKATSRTSASCAPGGRAARAHHHHHQCHHPNYQPQQQQQQQQQQHSLCQLALGSPPVPQPPQPPPWRSSRWIGRRGGKQASSAAATAAHCWGSSSGSASSSSSVHLLQPVQAPATGAAAAAAAAPGSSKGSPHAGGEMEGGAATPPGGKARPAALLGSCGLLNSDDDEEDEALAAMCCAAASRAGGRAGGGAGGGQLVFNDRGSPEGALASLLPGSSIGGSPQWLQQRGQAGFVAGNSESEAEPSYMLMGYGSLAESTAAYDEEGEEGEEGTHSKTSSPWASHNSLIARMHRHGSHHSDMHREGASILHTPPAHPSSPPQLPSPASPAAAAAAAAAAARAPPSSSSAASGVPSDSTTSTGTEAAAPNAPHAAAAAAAAAAEEGSGLQLPPSWSPANTPGGSSSLGEGGHEAEGTAPGQGHTGGQGAAITTPHAPGDGAAAEGGAQSNTPGGAAQQQQQQQRPPPQLVLRSSNATIVRHLAGAMARSRMRANAATMQAGLAGPVPHMPPYTPPARGAADARAPAGGLLAAEALAHISRSPTHRYGSAPSTPSRTLLCPLPLSPPTAGAAAPAGALLPDALGLPAAMHTFKASHGGCVPGPASLPGSPSARAPLAAAAQLDGAPAAAAGVGPEGAVQWAPFSGEYTPAIMPPPPPSSSHARYQHPSRTRHPAAHHAYHPSRTGELGRGALGGLRADAAQQTEAAQEQQRVWAAEELLRSAGATIRTTSTAAAAAAANKPRQPHTAL